MSLMRGISAPQLTPFTADGRVDPERYALLSQKLSDAGLTGIFVCGTTGEFVNLTMAERKELLKAARAGAGSKTRLMYNVTALNLEDLRSLIEWAKANGADCLSVTPPFYHGYDAAALTAYFRTVAHMAEGMPVYLYNIPGMVKNVITPAVLKSVCDACENVRGLKDSSMDYQTFLEFQLAVGDDEDFELITGNDAQVLTALEGGGAGGVIAMASVFPELCQSIYDLWASGRKDEAKKAQTTVMQLRSLVRRVMPIMAHKEVLRLTGFEMGPARFPLRELTPAEKDEVRRTLSALQLI